MSTSSLYVVDSSGNMSVHSGQSIMSDASHLSSLFFDKIQDYPYYDMEPGEADFLRKQEEAEASHLTRKESQQKRGYSSIFNNAEVSPITTEAGSPVARSQWGRGLKSTMPRTDLDIIKDRYEDPIQPRALTSLPFYEVPDEPKWCLGSPLVSLTPTSRHLLQDTGDSTMDSDWRENPHWKPLVTTPGKITSFLVPDRPSTPSAWTDNGTPMTGSPAGSVGPRGRRNEYHPRPPVLNSFALKNYQCETERKDSGFCEEDPSSPATVLRADQQAANGSYPLPRTRRSEKEGFLDVPSEKCQSKSKIEEVSKTAATMQPAKSPLGTQVQQANDPSEQKSASPVEPEKSRTSVKFEVVAGINHALKKFTMSSSFGPKEKFRIEEHHSSEGSDAASMEPRSSGESSVEPYKEKWLRMYRHNRRTPTTPGTSLASSSPSRKSAKEGFFGIVGRKRKHVKSDSSDADSAPTTTLTLKKRSTLPAKEVDTTETHEVGRISTLRNKGSRIWGSIRGVKKRSVEEDIELMEVDTGTVRVRGGLPAYQ